MAVLQDLIVSVRNLRAELKVEQKAKVPIEFYAHDLETVSLIEQNSNATNQLAGVSTITTVDEGRARQSPTRGTARFDVRVVYEKKIDVTAECERLKKELEKIDNGIASGQRQLGNKQFLAKAPPSVVENLRKQQQELAILREKTTGKLVQLGCP